MDFLNFELRRDASELKPQFEKQIANTTAIIMATQREISRLDSLISKVDSWSSRAKNGALRVEISKHQTAIDKNREIIKKVEENLAFVNKCIEEKDVAKRKAEDAIVALRNAGFIIYNNGYWAVSAKQVLRETKITGFVVHMPSETITQTIIYCESLGLTLSKAAELGDINKVPMQYRHFLNEDRYVWNIY